MLQSAIPVFLGLITVANLALFLIAFTKRHSNASSFYFSLLALLAAFWAGGITLLYAHFFPSLDLWITNGVNAVTSFIPFALLGFVLAFTKPRVKFKFRQHLPYFLLSLVFAICNLTGLVTTGILVKDSSISLTLGPLANIYALFLLLYFAASLILLAIGLYKSSGALRTQLAIVTFGLASSVLVALFSNLILPVYGGNNAIWLGPVGTSLLVFSIGYAILAHQLFDIRVVIRRTIIYASLLAFVFVVYATIVLLLTEALGITSSQTFRQGFFPNLVAALVIGFSIDPLRRWLSDRTDRWLFKKEYEQQFVLKDLGQKLNNVVGLDEALESVMQTVAKVLHLRHAVTYVFQMGENNSTAIKRVKQVGYSTSAKLLLEDKDFTVQFFSQHPAICLVSDLRTELEQEEALIEQKKVDAAFIRQHAIKQAVMKKLLSLEIAAAVPLQLNNQPLGLLLLSDKLSGESYRDQDLALLDLVGAQAISSIQKAKLFEGDQMKSEFVSIASHELLTPISAIEGYLSMILEENIGKVDPQARDYLNKVYTSAKRLSLLIKDLLSVSRIESGKMKVDNQQLDMAKMITDTLDQLKFVAADKQLVMKFEATEKALPPVWADPDRTMQVLVNLVSNAIKYTPKGQVLITAKSDHHLGMVTVTVTDTGLGMTKDQMAHLFTKFYRVDTPQTTGIIGTGLGLYITKSIIEKMGGTITCKSSVGQGSSFSFTLPIFKVETSVA